MLLMVSVTGDWYHHHYTPKLLLMKQLSWKMCLLPDTMCRLFQVSPLWAWWESTDNTMTTLRQEHQSHFPPHLNEARKLWRPSKGFSRRCRRGFSFQESQNFMHSSQSTQPAVISSSIQSFKCFCLGYNPMIGLWLCGSKKADFTKSKCEILEDIPFKCKTQYLKLVA